MEVRRLNKLEILDIFRKEGVILGDVVMDDVKLFNMCHWFNVDPSVFKEFF